MSALHSQSQEMVPQPTQHPGVKRLKFLLIRLIRAAGLLRLADRARFALGLRKARARNRKFLEEHPGFVPPPEDLAFDAYNHMDWRSYLEGGKLHAQFFAETIKSKLSAAKIDVLEWGCGPGRLIRHIPEELGHRMGAVHGTDYNTRSIEWCRRSLPGLSFQTNEFMPPLAFDTDSFDAVYCFSVFTHLSEAAQLAWAEELWRVLKPGGVLICSTHGEANAHLLASEQERADFANGKVVVQGRYEEGKKWFFAIHPHAFVRDRLLKNFEDVALVQPRPEHNFDQDAWCARKPS